MLKNIKLSTKLIGGFGIVLALLVAVIGIYQYSVVEPTERLGLQDLERLLGALPAGAGS